MGVARAARLAATRLLAIATIAAISAIPATARSDVDWAKGLVTAEGVGVANRAAPTPAAARGPARRLAADAARKRLAAELPGIPLADGGTLDARLGDATVKAAIDRAVANAVTVGAELETDGSWKITLGVPIEAIRQALAGGPRPLPAAGDAGPPVVIVDGVASRPAVGYQVGALAAATIFVKDAPAWARGAPRFKAKRIAAGVIDAPTGKATAATLFVILAKP